MKKNTIILILGAILAFIAYKSFAKSKNGTINNTLGNSSESKQDTTSIQQETINANVPEGVKTITLESEMRIIGDGQEYRIPAGTVIDAGDIFVEFYLPDGQFLRFRTNSLNVL